MHNHSKSRPCLTTTSLIESSSTTTTLTTPTSTTSSTTTASATSGSLLPLTPFALVNTALGDIIAIIPNFTSLVSSYRLLVGSAEEMQRIAGVPPAYRARAIDRIDQTGTLIDILLELLCCKISFSAELLQITCAPLDLLRVLSDRLSNCSVNPEHLARQLLELEVLLGALQAISPDRSCIDTPTALASQLTDAQLPGIPQPVNKQAALVRTEPPELETALAEQIPARPRRLGRNR